MKAEEKSTGKERVEAMHKKFEVGTDKHWNMMCAQLAMYVYVCTILNVVQYWCIGAFGYIDDCIWQPLC